MNPAEARAIEIHLGTGLNRRAVELTRAWLERLRGRLAVQPHRIFPSDTLLNHIPEVLRRVSDYLLSGGDAVAEQAVRDELALLARLRRDQGYDVDEIVAELEILGEILYEALREEADRYRPGFSSTYALEIAERLYHALMTITAVTARTFREEGFKDRRERARLLGTFGSTLAHEMRNRLAAGEAAVELIADPRADPAIKERALRTLHSMLRRLEALSEDVLALAIAQGSEESAQGRRLALPALIDEAVLGFETVLLEKQVRIEVAGTVPEVQVDATRVELVLINLLSNAVRYRDPAKDDCWVRISVERSGAFWCVAVADNGLGVPPGMEERVFEEFVRAHPKVMDGTGLGLAIARQAIEPLGGRIWLESEPGAGTTVYFTFVDPPEASV